MPRPTYTMVTFVLVCVSVIGALHYAFSGMIPLPPENSLADQPGEYVRQGSRQPVKWRLLSSETFAEARRLDKPIMLVLGCAWSSLARRADGLLFDAPDLAERINQQFIPVRVDLNQDPEFLSAFLPASRATVRFDTAFQIWFLDPAGRMYFSFLPKSRNASVDLETMILVVRTAQSQLQEFLRPGAAIAPGDIQTAELKQIREADSTVGPDFRAELARLMAERDKTNGGLPVAELQGPRPAEWNYMLLCGEGDAVSENVRPMLYSPIIDWIDGGFFRLSFSRNWSPVSFAKLATQNADMMTFLARLRLQSRTVVAFLSRINRDCFRLLHEGMGQGRSIRAFRYPDEVRFSRSARCSFSWRTVWSNFSSQDVAWLETNLNLDRTSNDQMIPVPANETLIQNGGQLDHFLGRLRTIKEGSEPTYGGDDLADVNGCVVARMIENARLTSDADQLKASTQRFLDLKRFRSGPDDVLHRSNFSQPNQPYLGDYLAYADAALQDFLVSGRATSLNDGASVLMRAIQFFQDENSGLLVASRMKHLEPGPADASTPQIYDDLGESLSAQAIRLAQSYGALLRATKSGRELRLFAVNSTGRFAQIANEMKWGVSSYYLAALQTRMDIVAFAVGPNSQGLSDELARLSPFLLSAPVVPGVGENVRKSAPGIYLVRQGNVAGPMTPSQAAENMSLHIQTTLGP